MFWLNPEESLCPEGGKPEIQSLFNGRKRGLEPNEKKGGRKIEEGMVGEVVLHS